MKLLTQEQEVALAIRVEDGDADARNELVVRNLRLVHWVVQKYRGTLQYADLQQEGNLGLIKSAGTFDYRRGVRFATHAVWRIRASISRYCQIHRFDSIEFDYEEHDTRTTPSGDGAADRKAAVSRSLRNLTRRERRVIELRFGLGGPTLILEEVALVFGITRERVRQIETKALGRLGGGWCELKHFNPKID